VLGVGGTWKDLTDNVNFMASNLTQQVGGTITLTRDQGTAFAVTFPLSLGT
jgi:hypothetical protein